MSYDPHKELRDEVRYAHIKRNVLQDEFERARQAFEEADAIYNTKFNELVEAGQSLCHKLIIHRRLGENVYCKRTRGHEGECFAHA